MIVIEVDARRVHSALARLQRMALDASPVMRAIAGEMHDAVEENFAQQGRPKWAGLKASTLAARKKSGYDGPILQRTGRLASSIEAHATRNTALVGTNVKYAAIHQFGGKTSPHVIRPRYKKALAFGGRVVKQVNHPGSTIPARPFLSLTDSDHTQIEGVVERYLRRAIRGG